MSVPEKRDLLYFLSVVFTIHGGTLQKGDTWRITLLTLLRSD